MNTERTLFKLRESYLQFGNERKVYQRKEKKKLSKYNTDSYIFEAVFRQKKKKNGTLEPHLTIV